MGRRAPWETPDWRPLQLTADEGCESAPALSPDGHTVAYVSDSSGNEDLWLIDVDGGGSVQLTDDPASDRSPAWFPDGAALVFVSGRSGKDAVWKVPRLGGSAVLLLPGAVDPAVSPDGRRIAFARQSPSGYLRIFVAPLDDLSQLTALTDSEGGLWDHQRPAWSPDGRSICYSDFRDLWVVPASGGPARRLTFAHAFDRDPVWSSTGETVLFSSMRGGTRALWRVGADGSSPARLTLGTGPEAQPSLSADGADMAYSTFRNDADIALVDLETRERRTVSTLWAETGPAFAPDRGRVVFSSDRSGDYELWVQDLDRAGRPRSMARRLTDLDGSEAVPAFSPDGVYLAFGRVRGEQRDIWVIPSAGGTAWQFTTDPSVDMHPAWSPDGSRLAFVSDRSGRHHVWVGAISAGRAAGPVRQLTTGEASDSFPAWSPDGDSIAFLRVTEEGSDVWLVSSTGGPPRRLTVDSGTLGLRWIAAGGGLLVAGTWGTEELSLRRVDASSGAVTPLEPRLVLGGLGSDIAGDFDASRDGRFVVFTEEKRQGNIWLLEAEKGSF
jgi:Tol biopolymer transport system component